MTAIPNAPQAECIVSLSARGESIIAHTWNSSWRVGIDGATVNFPLVDSDYDAADGTFALNDPTGDITVRFRPTGEVVTAPAPYYESQVIDVLISTGNLVNSVRAFRSCMPGD